MKVIKLENIDSTNSYAKLNIDTLEDKTVVFAHRQNNGRGRLNRSWVDLGEGNLFITFVLKPADIYRKILPNLTQYLSVCLCKVLETYGLKTQIKWPNDVLVNGKKIAGILSESVMQGTGLKGLALGIGVNLNSKKEDVEKIPNRIVTALNLEISQSVDLDKFFNELTKEFFKGYDSFLTNGFVQIKDDYIQRNCFINKELNVQIFNKVEKGLAKSVNDSGELVLLNSENKEVVLTIGDIL